MAKVKKVLKFVFLVLLVLFAFRSCCYAVDPAFNLVDTGFTESTKTPLDVYEYLFDTFNLVQNNNLIYEHKTTWQNVKNNFISAKCKIFFVNGSQRSLIWGNDIFINNSNQPTTRNISGRGCSTINLVTTNDYSFYSYYSGLYSCAIGTTNNTPLYYLYCDQYSHWWEYSSDSSISIGQISALDWEYSSGYQTTSVAGFSAPFYGYNTSYTVNYWNLGKLSGFENFDDIQFNLYAVFSPLNQVLLFNEHYKNENGVFTSGQNNVLFLSSGKLSIRSAYLSYMPYYLIIYVYDQNGVVQDSVEGYFVFRQLGSEIPAFIGSGDFKGSGDYTLQDSTINSDNLVNSLFTLSSGDIDDIYADVIAYFPSGDRPDQIYDIIFGTLKSEPSDFVISWGNIPVMLTVNGGQTVFSGDLISGDSINFSKLCRENDTMMLIKFYLNLFVIIFFIIAYLSTLYKCLLIMLGLSTDFVGDLMEPEHRQIGFINDWRDK